MREVMLDTCVMRQDPLQCQSVIVPNFSFASTNMVNFKFLDFHHCDMGERL
jgi:hypothetical protein